MNGVLADGRGGLRARLGLEHWQRSRGSKRRRRFGERFFFDAFVVTGGARTVFAEICEIEVAGVAVGPGDVHTSAGADVNLHAGGLASLVDGKRHVGRDFSN